MSTNSDTPDNSVSRLADKLTEYIDKKVESMSFGPGGMTGTTSNGEASGDWYDLDGLRIIQNPDKHLAGTTTDRDLYGLPYLESTGHKKIPNAVKEDYIPCELPGHVDATRGIVKKLSRGFPVYLEGEAGVAKNTAIAAICGETNRMVFRDNYGMDTSVFQVINDTDVQYGTTVNVLGNLTMAAIFGGTYNADEGNMAEGDVTSHLHAIFEEEGKRELKITGTDRTLVDLPEDEEWNPEKHLGHYIHPEFRAVATGNPISYAATKQQNNAFRDRFSIVRMEYIGAQEEAALLQAETGLSENDALALVEFANELREMQANDALDCPISHRRLIQAAYYKQDFDVSLEAAAESEIANYAQNRRTTRPKIMDAIADNL